MDPRDDDSPDDAAALATLCARAEQLSSALRGPEDEQLAALAELAALHPVVIDQLTRRPTASTRDASLRLIAALARFWWIRGLGPEVLPIVEQVSKDGATPLVVIDRHPDEPWRVLGVIRLKDTVKPGMRERFDELRAMGIRTVMITGDNPLTAAAIAEEAGVDDFLAEATPEDKMALIKREQAGGNLVAMTGDEALAAIESGDIRDAKSIIGILRWARRGAG